MTRQLQEKNDVLVRNLEDVIEVNNAKNIEISSYMNQLIERNDDLETRVLLLENRISYQG